MNGNRKFAVATALATCFGFASAPASAQTTAPGPYYATPSWDQTLPASTRFVVLSNFNNQAVLDRETGLVWQRTISGGGSWSNVSGACVHEPIGGRFGWRTPSVAELASLVDPTQTNPALPLGHPFQNVL